MAEFQIYLLNIIQTFKIKNIKFNLKQGEIPRLGKTLQSGEIHEWVNGIAN